MMKKIMSIFLCVILSACSLASHSGTTARPEENTVSAIPFEFPFQANKTWLGGSYEQEGSTKKIHLSANQEFSLRKENIFWQQDGNYRIHFSLNSTTTFQGNFFVKNGEKVLLEESLSSEQQDYEFSFGNGAETWLGSVYFSLQSGEENTLEIRDFQIENVEQRGKVGIRVNQIGYPSEAVKFLSLAFDGGDHFFLLRKEDQAIVYRGLLGNGKEDKRNGEYNFLGEFSSFQEEGEYFLRTETGLESFPFVIAKNPYQDAYQDALRFFTLQRSGISLSEEVAGDLAHEASHMQEAIPFGYGGITKDVHGGWYDAGDYGRYLQTGIKAVVPLLISYDWHQDKRDDYRLPESGNGMPDLLDEAKWELSWLLRMQREDGQVYNKLTTKQFAGDVVPEEDTADLYLLPPWQLTTTAFVGTMAYAARVYQEIDPAFAKEMEAVVLRWGEKVLSYRSSGNYENPEGFSTGQYNDNSDRDELFFAALAMYSLTQERVYLRKAEELWQEGDLRGQNASDLSEYGEYLVLRYVDTNEKLYRWVKESIVQRADHAISALKQRNYPYPLGEYPWGSNQLVAEEIFQVVMASLVTGQEYYRDYGQLMLNYLLGQNSLNYSFLVGHGELYPKNAHSRNAYARNTILPGALVGGANQFLSEDHHQFFNEEIPLGKRYRDHYFSYNTNEVAIAYNGAFFLALSFYKPSVVN